MSDVAPLEAYYPVPYWDYLDQGEIWPRLAEGAVWANGVDRQLVWITLMPPQQAAASLAKLVRWAVHAPAGDLLAIAEVGAREEYARTSMLGRALAARAQNLDVGEAHAIAQGEPAKPNHLVAHVMVALYERTPMDEVAAIDVAADIVDRLLRRYVITERS